MAIRSIGFIALFIHFIFPNSPLGEAKKKACLCWQAFSISLINYMKSKQYPAVHAGNMMMQVMDVLIKCHYYCGTNVTASL
jgi:hypothetical protein